MKTHHLQQRSLYKRFLAAALLPNILPTTIQLSQTLSLTLRGETKSASILPCSPHFTGWQTTMNVDRDDGATTPDPLCQPSPDDTSTTSALLKKQSDMSVLL
jgi:hypothetical protein